MDLLQKLKQDFINSYESNQTIKKYIGKRIDIEERYSGWVALNPNSDATSLELDLHNSNDRFLLYCLSSAWSASGQWENAATLIYSIKHSNLDIANPTAWTSNNFMSSKLVTFEEFKKNSGVFEPRKKVNAPRQDIFPAINTIANNWDRIENIMAQAHKSNDWEQFIHKIRQIKGLAPRGNCLNIKIPLILRELRCQNVFNSIPGELCCVPDARVINAIKYLVVKGLDISNSGLKTHRPSRAEELINFSKSIYLSFGDLYDIPLFAAYDLYPDFNIVLNSY